MRQEGWKLTLAALVTSSALLALLTARHAGIAVPSIAVVTCGAAAVPAAVAAGLQRLVYLWRGPSVMSFSRIDAVRCGGAEAEAIRAAAQLRGTLGGAGHVYRPRLAFHALACFAAALLGALALAYPGGEAIGEWPLALVAGTGMGAVLLPSRPFYYREAMNGEILVTPPLARGLIASSRAAPRRERNSAPADVPAAPDVAGRGNTPNAVPTGRKPAGVEIRPER